MAKPSKEEIEQIIAEQAPGYELAEPQVQRDARTTRAEPEESSPDIAELREKYLGEGAGESEAQPTDAAPEPNPSEADAGEAGEEMEDVIARVQRTDAADPWDHESRPKTVIISGKEKRIIGSQG